MDSRVESVWLAAVPHGLASFWCSTFVAKQNELLSASVDVVSTWCWTQRVPAMPHTNQRTNQKFKIPNIDVLTLLCCLSEETIATQ